MSISAILLKPHGALALVDKEHYTLCALHSRISTHPSVWIRFPEIKCLSSVQMEKDLY